MDKNQLHKNTEFSLKDPKVLWTKLEKSIQPQVTNIYETLSKTGHFNNEQSVSLVKNFFAGVRKIARHDQIDIIAMTVLIDQLMKKATNYDTYRFRQNRFLAFFNELLHQGYPALKRESDKGAAPFYEWFTSFLFQQLTKYQHRTAYEKLTATWLLCEQRESVLKQHAEKLANMNEEAFFTKLASLLYLQANNGARSLALLKDHRATLHHSELVDHFNIMEQKKDFVMMKHWFNYFFPFEKPKKGTTLGKLYEEMLVETGTEEEKITVVWKNWLEQPSFKTYKSRMKKSSQTEKEKILSYILPKLQINLYRPQNEAIYYQIITEEALFEQGMEALLTQKKDVSIISDEIEKFLTSVMNNQPQLLLPFYHQLVERLIQKKSRNHYEDAVYYIRRLKIIYEKINKQKIFSTFQMGLKQRFKTYRAFIQELKKIEQ